MGKLKIETAKVADLTPYVRNAMKHPPEQVRELARGIKEFGFLQPILVDADGVIVTGHGRLLAAQQLGMDEVPIIRTTSLTAEQVRLYRIADNKLARKSTFDMDAIAAELRELAELDEELDLELTGFEEIEIEGLMEVDFLPQTPPQPQSAPAPVHVPMAAPSTMPDRGETEQLRREPQQASGELVELRPTPTSDQHSKFECIMLHSNKVELVEILDGIRAEHGFDKIEDALMHLARSYGEEN